LPKYGPHREYAVEHCRVLRELAGMGGRRCNTRLMMPRNTTIEDSTRVRLPLKGIASSLLISASHRNIRQAKKARIFQHRILFAFLPATSIKLGCQSRHPFKPNQEDGARSILFSTARRSVTWLVPKLRRIVQRRSIEQRQGIGEACPVTFRNAHEHHFTD